MIEITRTKASRAPFTWQGWNSSIIDYMFRSAFARGDCRDGKVVGSITGGLMICRNRISSIVGYMSVVKI